MVLKPALHRLMDCWTFMCTVCNVCRSDGGDQLVKVNRVKQTNKSVRLTEVVRALPVPTILHAPHVTAPLRDVWSARPGDGKDRMLHDEAFRSFSSMYVLGLCNRRRCLGVCWGRESSRELKVLASRGPSTDRRPRATCPAPPRTRRGGSTRRRRRKAY